MRLHESMSKLNQGFALILTGLILCGFLMAASICLAAGDKWTKKADMPTAREDMRASAVNGKIYVIGGQRHWFVDTLAAVEEYDPLKDS